MAIRVRDAAEFWEAVLIHLNSNPAGAIRSVSLDTGSELSAQAQVSGRFKCWSGQSTTGWRSCTQAGVSGQRKKAFHFCQGLILMGQNEDALHSSRCGCIWGNTCRVHTESLLWFDICPRQHCLFTQDKCCVGWYILVPWRSVVDLCEHNIESVFLGT